MSTRQQRSAHAADERVRQRRDENQSLTSSSFGLSSVSSLSCSSWRVAERSSASGMSFSTSMLFTIASSRCATPFRSSCAKLLPQGNREQNSRVSTCTPNTYYVVELSQTARDSNNVRAGCSTRMATCRRPRRDKSRRLSPHLRGWKRACLRDRQGTCYADHDAANQPVAMKTEAWCCSPGVDLAHQGVPGRRLRERVQAVAHVGFDEVQPREGFHVGVRSVIDLFQLSHFDAETHVSEKTE